MRSTGLLLALALLVGACAPSSPEAADPFDAVALLRGRVCGRDMVGGAVVVGPGLLVTVAHNVAGSQGGLNATFEDGLEHPVTLVGIDVDRDLALLSAPTVRHPSILLAHPTPGENGRIIRLRGQAKRAEVLFTDAEPVTAVGRNLYDEESTARRENVRVRAEAGAGYSGSPVLNSDDHMTGLVYATARLEDMTYANASAEVESFLAASDPTTEANPGHCP